MLEAFTTNCQGSGLDSVCLDFRERVNPKSQYIELGDGIYVQIL